MKKIIYRSCILTLSLFFMRYNIKAMEETEASEDPWGLIDHLDIEQDRESIGGSIESSISSRASTMVPESIRPLQEMKFDILREAYRKIASENNLTRSFEHREPRSFSDNSIHRALSKNRKFLYSSEANIKHWQIIKKTLEIINERIKNHTIGTVGSLENLRSFKETSLKDLKIAIIGRKVFLKSALEVAAELKMWEALYERHKVHLEVENAEASENIQAMLSDKAMLTQCKKLYQAKDSIDALWNKELNECQSFVQEIKDFLEPCIIPIEDDLFTLQHAQKESFLEEKKSAFENADNVQTIFNLEDGKIVLETLTDMLIFYSNERARSEAMIEAQETAAAAQIAIAEERAARAAAENATEMERLKNIEAREAETREERAVKNAVEAVRARTEASIELMRVKTESSMEVAVAAEKAARITAETAAEAVRVRNEATIEAAKTAAAAAAAVAAGKEARLAAETAAQVTRIKNEAAAAAEKAAQNSQDVQRANTFGVAATLGTGVALVTYGVASPILVPASVFVGIVTSAYSLLR